MKAKEWLNFALSLCSFGTDCAGVAATGRRNRGLRDCSAPAAVRAWRRRRLISIARRNSSCRHRGCRPPGRRTPTASRPGSCAPGRGSRVRAAWLGLACRSRRRAPPRHRCHRHSAARCRFSVEGHREAGRSRRYRPREISRHCAGERPQKPSAPESSGRAASPSC